MPMHPDRPLVIKTGVQFTTKVRWVSVPSGEGGQCGIDVKMLLQMQPLAYLGSTGAGKGWIPAGWIPRG